RASHGTKPAGSRLGSLACRGHAMPSSPPEAPRSVRIRQGHPTYAEPDRHAEGRTGASHPDSQQASPPPAAAPDADSEVLDDGQEEVFSHSAVERGLTKDPKALGPEDVARAPMSSKIASGKAAG